MSISEAQVASALRYTGVFASGALTLVGTLAVLSSTQAVDAQAALKDIIAGLTQAWHGFWVMGVIIGPGIAALLGKWGWHAVSPAAQATSLGQTAPNGSVKVIVSSQAPVEVQDVATDRSEATKNVTMEVSPKPPLNIPRRRS